MDFSCEHFEKQLPADTVFSHDEMSDRLVSPRIVNSRNYTISPLLLNDKTYSNCHRTQLPRKSKRCIGKTMKK
ncbi:unnamed protein product [Caenorhabditis angaria]|uniref:Uncharacterized protein n=1 Tax=Caenorhabditis angaria TaxID=860376 RepID=A0A9P1IIL1_9PELO|nr:unnamed protein product [Caenorhabditis angaria]